jgi:hypothetical protein
MTDTQQDFATRSTVIRRAIAAHRPWVEQKLGVCLSEAVIIDGLPNLSQVGVQKYLGITDRRRSGTREARRLRPLVAQAEVPPQSPPILTVADDVTADLSLEALFEDRAAAWTGFEWRDCPLALRLHVYNLTVVTLNVSYHAGPGSPGETTARLLIARRDSVPALLRLFEDLYQRDRTPHLHTAGDRPRRIPRVAWSDLVISADVSSLLKSDFESFWEREKWFRERNLPFRRGYLLHGPPGNGKTSAIRAMMTSRNLNAHTLRFFGPELDDGDLDRLFDKVHRDRPAIVLFEDIDRAFPRTGESASRISLQHLLNCLDGVATGEAIVVIATANEPTALDPAILRRPGRFDRVVHFPNPDPALRLEYLRRMNSSLGDAQLQGPVQATVGFSFAQLREAYVIAGQQAFERGDEVTKEDLLAGIMSLRQSMIGSARHGNAAGFHGSAELLA